MNLGPRAPAGPLVLVDAAGRGGGMRRRDEARTARAGRGVAQRREGRVEARDDVADEAWGEAPGGGAFHVSG